MDKLLDEIYDELLDYSYNMSKLCNKTDLHIDMLHDAILYFKEKYYNSKKNLPTLKKEALKLIKVAIKKGYSSSTSQFNRKYIKPDKNNYYINNYENYNLEDLFYVDDVDYDKEAKLNMVYCILEELNYDKKDKKLFKQYYENGFVFEKIAKLNNKNYSKVYLKINEIKDKIKEIITKV